MTDQDHIRNRSLSWVRRIKGEPPNYYSARHAMDDATAERHEFTKDTILPLGAVVFYDDGPNGDVGLYVGNETVLRLHGGTPVVRSLVRDKEGQPRNTPTNWATRINP